MATHHLSESREYFLFKTIKAKCYTPTSNRYEYYGARGISMFIEWKDNFLKFYEYIQTLPQYEQWKDAKSKLSLDRIDNDGDYEPGNLRFATKLQQTHNRRIFKNNSSGYRCVHFHTIYNCWRAVLRIDGKKKSLGSFKTAIDAAKAYNEYVIEHKLDKPLNII